jgi:DnaJ-class molecular chaperone
MQQPLAVCTECGDFAWGASQINQQCGKRYGRERCRGMYEAALHYSFEVCPDCKGEGRVAGSKCVRCGGQRLIADRFKLEE